MIRILELFGGIGACTKALERLGIEHEIADYVEIDKYAVKSFNALHNTNYEPQDICEWSKDIPVDFIMHGSPCQDFSIAGKQAGGNEGSGTRSSLLYETLRIVEKTRPKVVLWENVKNLMSARHKPNWERYCQRMEELGYRNYAKVLNAKDYGIPQNRERVYTMSIRNDIPGDFEFPEPETLTKRLKDMLEYNVDEKYYLSEEQTKRLQNSSFNSQKARENDPESTVGTLCARDYKGPQCVRLGGLYIKDATSLTAGGNFDTINGGAIGKMHDISRRAYHEDAIAPAMHTCGGGNTEPKVKLPGAYGREFGSRGKIQDMEGHSCTLLADMGTGGGNVPLVTPEYRIRKLTPKEYWRLMGFDDADFDKAEKVNSNTQLYKQAGNSIVVNVLEKIIANLPKEVL